MSTQKIKLKLIALLLIAILFLNLSPLEINAQEATDANTTSDEELRQTDLGLYEKYEKYLKYKKYKDYKDYKEAKKNMLLKVPPKELRLKKLMISIKKLIIPNITQLIKNTKAIKISINL